jgi:hypothetical protein
MPKNGGDWEGPLVNALNIRNRRAAAGREQIAKQNPKCDPWGCRIDPPKEWNPWS